MGRIIRLLIVLAALSMAALIAYAYLGDLAPEPREIRAPVTIDVAP